MATFDFNFLIRSIPMLPNKEGNRVPSVVFRTRQGDGWLDVSTDQLFSGKRVIVFALPGAFTPTCSSTHLPRYDELAEVFGRHGIDDIICLSVNDGFVMQAWGKDQGTERVTLIGDGNGEFTAAMGMLVDKSDLGFGKRSWRYSMVVEDGVIEKMFIEPEVAGDPFELSDADTMLSYIAPSAAEPINATLITRQGCGHCNRARDLLVENGIHFEEIELGRNGVSHITLHAMSGASTTPQAFINGEPIGGSEALEKWCRSKFSRAA